MLPFDAREDQAALIDIDGTLVDSTYLHAIAWAAALRLHGFDFPTWRSHRLIGMRGERLLAELLGPLVDEAVIEALSNEHARQFAAVRHQVAPLAHARALLAAIAERDMPVVLVSSADEEEVEHYIDLLDARDLVSAWTSAGDGSRSKPDPEQVRIAMQRSGRESAIVIGDSTWDCLAASAAGQPAVAVLTGGFSRSELEAAGAAAVYEHLGEIRDNFDQIQTLTPQAG
jgi:HAD superfamily hydrolase (TIGR01549 family)